MMVTVALDPWEVDWAKHVGEARSLNNLSRPNNAYYGNEFSKSKSMEEDIAGCAGELAVAKHLNIYWSGAAWPHTWHELMRNEPDLRPNIEVRHINVPTNRLAVRKNDVEHKRDIFLTYVYPNLSTVDVIGWLEAEQAWEVGNLPPWDDGGLTKLVDNLHLKDPNLYWPRNLNDEVRFYGEAL